MITKPNIFHRLSTFRLNFYPESNNSFLVDMTTMLNSKKYMVSTSFITQTGALRLSAAEAMWKLVKGQALSTTDTEHLFFQPTFTPRRPGAAVPGERYFDADTTSDPEIARPEPNVVDLTATEGFLAAEHPQGPVPPATSNDLSPFIRRQLDAQLARMRPAPPPAPMTMAEVRQAPGSTAAHASEDIRPDSPRSVDSGEHESDAEFIDDNVDLDKDPDDLYTHQ